jgi:hypothetical protein
MNSRIKLACGALLLASCGCMADVKYFNPQSNDEVFWAAANAWKDAPVGGNSVLPPGANDRAVIMPGKKCVIPPLEDITIDSLDIRPNPSQPSNPGLLIVRGDDDAGPDDTAVLILENDNDNVAPTGADHSIIDGVLRLDADGTARLAVLIIKERSHRFTGAGRVEGFESPCEVQIDQALTLTNELNASDGGFIGTMTIKTFDGFQGGTTAPNFVNKGNVVARYNGSSWVDHRVINLAANLKIGDITGADWKAVACGVLIFDRSALLSGNILLDSSESYPAGLQIRQAGTDIATTGMFTFTSGDLKVYGNTSFCFTSFASGCYNDYPCFDVGDYNCQYNKGPNCSSN